VLLYQATSIPTFTLQTFCSQNPNPTGRHWKSGSRPWRLRTDIFIITKKDTSASSPPSDPSKKENAFQTGYCLRPDLSVFLVFFFMPPL